MNGPSIRFGRGAWIWLGCLVVMPVIVPRVVRGDEPKAEAAAEPDRNAAELTLERLKQLEGKWVAVPRPDATPERAGDDLHAHMSVVYRVTAGGSAVMETLFPGSDHEMVSVYHLNGNELEMTHYCAAGNQPRFRAKLPAGENRIDFEFAGGTNFDPATDMHIHDGYLKFLRNGRLESSWSFWSEGKPVDKHAFLLERADKAKEDGHHP